MNSGFEPILQRAMERKGGEEALDSLVPRPPPDRDLVERSDRFFLAEMTRSVFQSGFVWRVINNKWPSFQEAFLAFDAGGGRR